MNLLIYEFAIKKMIITCMPDYDFEFSTIKKVSCFHTQCEKKLHNSGFGCFPTDPDFLDIKQTDRVSSETCCSMQNHNGHEDNSLCYVLVHTLTLLFRIPRNTCLPSQSSETCQIKNNPFDSFNRIASGDLIIMSHPKLHPHWSPCKLRFLQIPLNIKCLSTYFYLSDRGILHQEYFIP